MKTFTKVYLSALVLCCGIQSLSAAIPTTDAPIPPDYNDADVKAFICDKYTLAKEYQASGLPNWGQTATYKFVEFGEVSSAMLIENLGGKGWLPVAFTSGVLNIKDYEFLHVDLYCNENTSFRAGFHSNYQHNGLAGEYYFPFISYTTPGEWASFDWPLSILTDQGFDLGQIALLRFGYDLTKPETPDGTVYSNEIYVSNMYAYKGLPISGTKTIQKDDPIKVYPSVVKDDLTLESTESIADVSVYNVTGQKAAGFTVNSTSDKLNLSKLCPGSYIVSFQLSSGKTITKRIIKL